MESMVFGLSVTFIGISMVFLVLWLISMGVDLIAKFINSRTGGGKQNKGGTTIEAKAEVVPKQNQVMKAVAVPEATDMSLELVAAITAAVAACLNTTADKLFVRNITRVPGWADAAKRERH